MRNQFIEKRLICNLLSIRLLSFWRLGDKSRFGLSLSVTRQARIYMSDWCLIFHSITLYFTSVMIRNWNNLILHCSLISHHNIMNYAWVISQPPQKYLCPLFLSLQNHGVVVPSPFPSQLLGLLLPSFVTSMKFLGNCLSNKKSKTPYFLNQGHANIFGMIRSLSCTVITQKGQLMTWIS